ncbi:MAG: glycoside hydrolase family 2 TIM barrel-domain containing protein [Lachnospiraceae bacterium]|nr:glycoside hydrolase family 2 TIM barrel-domain containing protein [Lachnospiraceae bacterium]
MTEKFYLDRNWKFQPEFSDAYVNRPMEHGEEIMLPHTVKILPYDYFDENSYQMLSCYQRKIIYRSDWQNKRLILTFDGCAHQSQFYLNGEKIGEHHCGYTAYSIDISGKLKEGSNLLTVRMDSRENLNQPPFGYVIDYMTYGGIYRDVYLTVTEKEALTDVFFQPSLTSDGRGSLRTSISVTKEAESMIWEGKASILIRLDGKEILREKIDPSKREAGRDLSEDLVGLSTRDTYSFDSDSLQIKKWDIDDPALYQAEVLLLIDGEIRDQKTESIGFRTMEWKADGFYLNGRKVKIRGLNRHQSYPYVGYAMPESMQRMDARILKEELGVNTVRTSHYPQSQYFIDECDRLGLLVFTEIPGWQHIGEGVWKDQAVLNVRDMILQYRNHPSIMIWGVRINESKDDDPFYARTNAVAHAFDGSRATGGVRCRTADKNTRIQEDVFTYNDFFHNGKNKGCLKKKKATNDLSKAYLVTEHNGHMYPTKAFDWEEHRQSQAIRHARVISDVGLESDIAGSIGWCMFDYNTHKDFGSGDRICYHGVCDMYRNPKLAAFVYAAEGRKQPVLEISSTMDIGEHPESNRGRCYIITNADSVDMYKNGRLLKEYSPSDSAFRGMKHGPILIDDYIGKDLETIEGMTADQARTASDLLNSFSLNQGKMTGKMILEAIKLIVRYHMNPADAIGLYQKYIGNWGEKSTEYEFIAKKDGQVVSDRKISPMTQRQMDVRLSSERLVFDKTYDVLAIRLSMRDEHGNLLSFCNEPVEIEIDGQASVIGPKVTSLRGGMGGFYLKSVDQEGEVHITIRSENAEDKTFVVEAREKRE